MTLVQIAGSYAAQEIRPSCCNNGHPWRPGGFRVVGHHVRSWQCVTCGDTISEGRQLRLDYPEPIGRPREA